MNDIINGGPGRDAEIENWIKSIRASGEAGLTTALHEIGYVLTDYRPDYVVLGETRRYDFGALTTAVRLVKSGSRLICTNPDTTGPSPEGLMLGVGAVAAMITAAR